MTRFLPILHIYIQPGNNKWRADKHSVCTPPHRKGTYYRFQTTEKAHARHSMRSQCINIPIIEKTSMQPKVQGDRKALVALRRGRNLLVACSRHSFVDGMKAHAYCSMRLVLFNLNGSGSFRRNRGHDRHNGNHGRPHGRDGCTLLRIHTAAYPSAALQPPRPRRRKRRQTA